MFPQGFNSLSFPRDTILATLKANREAHVAKYKEAMGVWSTKIYKRLGKVRKELKAGNTPDLSAIQLDLPRPLSHVDSYDLAIEMLTAAAGDVVTLTMEQYLQFVKDQWTWSPGWTYTNSLYAS